ncbi:hypothetical protein SAMN02910292_01155 [Lachnospiraceae bacterium XBB2008]|nr:hypothetical protein SAMN02910292_01155 [Lachnospiraceae bacterium XBB2008]
MQVTTAEELFSSSLNYIMINDNVLEDARNKFVSYKKAGVIKEVSNFEDEAWYTTDEYSNIGLHFTFNRFAYKKYQRILNLEFNTFVDYVKIYCLSLFGKNVLMTIESTILDLRHIIETDINDIFGTTDALRLYFPNRCIDFFSLVSTDDDNGELNTLIQSLEAYCENTSVVHGDLKRTLADFDTYFRFNDIIKDFWKSDLTEDDRLFYYPLYLWWIITGVIPLRPREFLLTERECLTKDTEGKYHLRLRRNKLKGTRSSVSYTIRESYSTNTYPVPDYLGELIENYKRLTEAYDNTDLNTLFITDAHYKKWGHNKHSDSRYLTYVNMNTILRYFYVEVIQGKYGYKVIYSGKDGHLEDDEISYIHLGDTRHIALINILQEGGSPVAAMLLAGHEDINMTAHYYSNVSTLIECKTYQQHIKCISTDKKLEIVPQNLLPPPCDGVELSDGGMCYSQKYKEGITDDCLDCIGPNGEIGYCPECPYYRRKEMSYFSIDDKYKQKINDDSEFLAYTVSLVRQNKGYSEDIIAAILKYSADCYSYQDYLEEKYRLEGKTNGKTETD